MDEPKRIMFAMGKPSQWWLDFFCNFEAAVKLKKLGVPQEIAEQYFYERAYLTRLDESTGQLVTLETDVNIAGLDCYISGMLGVIQLWAAFSIIELGKMLPKKVNHLGKNYCLRGTDKLSFYYHEEDEPDGLIISPSCYFDEKSETDQRVELLIHLLENKIIKPQDIKYAKNT